MPNSSWTETGSSVSLTPVTTIINAGSDPENVNYLSNQDKINLMAQYSAELAMKTSLDTLASTWSVSSTYYDNAVAAISTALINAGAPSNWATTWPDGTTSGPWTGIQTSLSNLWAQVATQRTALQSSISAAQAAAAQVAAIASSLAVPTVVSSLPSLPSSSYPSGAFVFNTATNILYQSTGSAWTPLTISGSSLVANSVTANAIAANSITAMQINSGYVYTGNVSANQITTGTLNAANVAVTNLNASNITTGTLSASKVLFADGTALTTASRVQTASALAPYFLVPAASGITSVPGLSFSVTAASTSDTFNVWVAVILQSKVATPNGACQLAISTDDSSNWKYTDTYSCQGIGTVLRVNFFCSFSGLSAGTHTIKLYAADTSSTPNEYDLNESTAICQRIF